MSFWEKDLDNSILPSLKKDIEIDTLIIGGGIAGLTALYYLKDKEDVFLVDANKVGSGVTKNTTGKLTYLQNTIYSDLINNIDYETAVNYLDSQKKAIELAKEIIKKEKIDCSLEKVTSYVFTNKKSEVKKLKQEYEFLSEQKKNQSTNITSQFSSFYENNIQQNTTNVNSDKLPLSIPYIYAISVPDTYVFHPIKYINHLKKITKDKIYENTKITKIIAKNNKYICYSENNKIIANKVIIACHYPFFLLPFCFPLKSHIEKSYIIVKKVKENPKLSCINVTNPSISIRYYEENKNVYQICLACSHKTSKNQEESLSFDKVKQIFNCEDKDIVASWSNVDIITDDKMPYIGEIKKNMYLATGFNTWGMTNGILAAYMLSRYVLGESIPYKDLFSLKRSNFYQIKSFFPNIWGSIISYRKKRDNNTSLIYTKKNGQDIAIYKDKNNKKHIVLAKCPHLGCRLLFNEKELTWDCPCHSSRFTIDGYSIKGPSLKDICYKE